MDRADDTSEPTAAPPTAPQALPRVLPNPETEGVAAVLGDRQAPGTMADPPRPLRPRDFLHWTHQQALDAAVVGAIRKDAAGPEWREAEALPVAMAAVAAEPLRPLRPRDFLRATDPVPGPMPGLVPDLLPDPVSGAQPDPAPVSDWFLPLPTGVPGFSAGVSSGLAADAGTERAFEVPSVGGTVAVPARGYGAGAGDAPLPAEDVFAEIDAEAAARSLTAAETAIAAAIDGAETPARAEDFVVPPPPPPFFEPRLPPPPPPPAFAPLVADPTLRPDLVRLEVRRQPVWPPAPPAVEGDVADEKIQDDVDTGDRAPRDYRALAWRAGRIIGIAAALWLSVVLVLILAYRFVNPPVSALMLQKWVFGQDIAHEWVPIEEMSPNIVRAVLLSEDGRFCQHYGVDFDALQDAVARTGGAVRGASTISMQVIKNLFLWPSKSYLRKAIELPLTYAMELVWPKRRIMEVYLNIAEWGPGIFGIEMASQFHFRKPAKDLNEREAARLAVALPNPFARNAGKPGPGMQRLAGAVQVRMRLAPSSQMACVIRKRAFDGR